MHVVLPWVDINRNRTQFLNMKDKNDIHEKKSYFDYSQEQDKYHEYISSLSALYGNYFVCLVVLCLAYCCSCNWFQTGQSYETLM